LEKTVTWLTEEKYKNPLYILVNGRTASAAEAFAYVLQAHKRAKVIGQASAGAANMNIFYRVNKEYYVSVSVAAPALPGTDSSWEQKGVQPDHVTKPGEEIKVIRELIAVDKNGKPLTSSGNTTAQPHSQ
jgi:Periplasmic protease